MIWCSLYPIYINIMYLKLNIFAPTAYYFYIAWRSTGREYHMPLRPPLQNMFLINKYLIILFIYSQLIWTILAVLTLKIKKGCYKFDVDVCICGTDFDAVVSFFKLVFLLWI